MPSKSSQASGSASPPQTATAQAAVCASKITKLDRLEALLRREGGASLAQMMEETGWQQHSVRGAMAGALKKRGVIVGSEKVEGERRYSVQAA